MTDVTKVTAATGDPPKSVPATPIELSGKTQKEKITEITTKLEQGIKDLFASDKFKEYLSAMSKLHRYSFRNSLLIFMQKPDASMVAGYTSWQRNFKRQVRKGEHGIKIFAPAPYKATKEVERIDKATNQRVIGRDGKPVTDTVEYTVPAFKITTVFDVSQTDGEPIPSLGVDELTGSVEKYADFYSALEKISPVPIGFENIEIVSTFATQKPTSGRPPFLAVRGTKGYYSNVEKRIAVQEGMSEVQTLKTLIHEISHAKLHAVEDINNAKPEEQIDRNKKEVEAESIAYTVCQRYGIDTSDYTFGYVAGWSSDKELPELKASLATIQKTADEIITGIEEHFAELAKDKTVTHEKETYDHGFTELSEKEAAEGAKIFEQPNTDKTAPAAAEKTQTAAADEKTIKSAVMDALKERIAYSNDGMLSTYKMSEHSRCVLWDNKCTSTHYIRVDFLEKVVLGEIKRLTKFATQYETELANIVMGHSIQAAQQEQKMLQNELNGLLGRDRELDILFEKIYEDNVSGKISDERFAKMSSKYEKEQKDINTRMEKIEQEISQSKNRTVTTDMFLATLRKYTRARKLTPRMLNELIEKIEVHQAEKIDGKTVQQLTIHYTCVGDIDIPELAKIPANDVTVNTRQGVNINYAV